MHFLVTNDDGISSEGLRSLVDAALRRGHRVTISAPHSQCSANSQHITLTHPLLVHKVPWEGVEAAYSVEGTPTDCVRIAPTLISEHFDFCLSGINRGENAGSAVYYSGTVAAAREAAMMYLPAIAVSIRVGADESMRQKAADIAVRTAEQFQGKALPRFCLININAPAIPVDEWKDMAVCPLSQAYYVDSYEKRQSPFGQTYLWLSANDNSGVPMEKPEEGSDYACLLSGHVTCTFLGAFADHNAQLAQDMQDMHL